MNTFHITLHIAIFQRSATFTKSTSVPSLTETGVDYGSNHNSQGSVYWMQLQTNRNKSSHSHCVTEEKKISIAFAVYSSTTHTPSQPWGWCFSVHQRPTLPWSNQNALLDFSVGRWGRGRKTEAVLFDKAETFKYYYGTHREV